MEQQTELIAAAEAVRTWVLAQRVTWAGDRPLPRIVDDPSAPQHVAAKSVEAVLPLDAAPPPVELPSDAEPVPELRSLAPFLRLPEPVTSVYVESPRRFLSGRLLARAAVFLATCGILGTGGFAAWKRYGTSGPRTASAAVNTTSTVTPDGPGGAPVVNEGKPAPTSGPSAGTSSSVTKTGVMQISSTPSGARVLVDGRERGVTPLELNDIPAGAHVVQIESSEGSIRRSVDLLAGKTEVIVESIYPGWVHVSAPFDDVVVTEGANGVQLDARNQALMKAGAHTLRVGSRRLGFLESRQVVVEPGGTTEVAIASRMSTLTVSGPDGADVLVDRERVGQVPLTAYPVQLGSRDVEVVEKSGVTHHQSVTITSQPASIDIPASQP